MATGVTATHSRIAAIESSAAMKAGDGEYPAPTIFETWGRQGYALEARWMLVASAWMRSS